MGLDQYAYSVPPPSQREFDFTGDEAEFHIDEDEETEKVDIMQWRKHNRLQGWMENLYYEKGGTAEMFNCVEVELLREDLDALEDIVENKALPETQGFFFGDDSYADYEHEEWGYKKKTEK